MEEREVVVEVTNPRSREIRVEIPQDVELSEDAIKAVSSAVQNQLIETISGEKAVARAVAVAIRIRVRF